jgi:DNA-binding NarL/FixJ family response regulator
VAVTVSVLVVDDDAGFRRLAAWVVANMGLTVAGEADSVAEALRSASELEPDAVLVDVGLPDGDGRALATRLAALPWRPRVVLISSDADAVSSAEVCSLGVSGFIPKAQLANPQLRRLLTGE